TGAVRVGSQAPAGPAGAAEGDTAGDAAGDWAGGLAAAGAASDTGSAMDVASARGHVSRRALMGLKVTPGGDVTKGKICQDRFRRRAEPVARPGRSRGRVGRGAGSVAGPGPRARPGQGGGAVDGGERELLRAGEPHAAAGRAVPAPVVPGLVVSGPAAVPGGLRRPRGGGELRLGAEPVGQEQQDD